MEKEKFKYAVPELYELSSFKSAAGAPCDTYGSGATTACTNGNNASGALPTCENGTGATGAITCSAGPNPNSCSTGTSAS
jgi:hypothetical protein